MPDVPLLYNYVSSRLPQCSVHQQYIVTGTVPCQIYEHGRGLAFHFDKDEHLLKEEGTMVHPIVNSIIYLTGDSTKSRQGVEGTLKSESASSFVLPCAFSAANGKSKEVEKKAFMQAKSLYTWQKLGLLDSRARCCVHQTVSGWHCSSADSFSPLWLPGPTVVVDQQHCSSGGGGETPRRSLLAYPRQNSLLMFDGRLGAWRAGYALRRHPYDAAHQLVAP